MPAKTKRQQQFMAICAHSPGKARGKCPSREVAREFSHKPEGGYGKRQRKRQRMRKHQMPRADANGYY